MPVKGQTNNPNGRKKGIPNKATTRFKEALNDLLETAADDMLDWLKQIDDPKDRFNVLKDFAEYIHPKLSRAESQMLDRDGNPADHVTELTVRLVDGGNNNTKGV